MKKLALLATVTVLMVFTGAGSVGAASAPATFYYGDVTLTGGSASGNFPQTWDLTACPVTIKAKVNLNGLSDAAGAHAWSELGGRDTTSTSNFNPPSGKGVWLATDYDWTVGTFAPDPVGFPTLDTDDKLILQKVGGQGEGAYNLPSTPSVPGNNHNIWFDRDGVDPYQENSPLAVNGGNYNTGGKYDVAITLKSTGPTAGTAYMTVNTLSQGFETDGNWDTMELSPAGMTFTGDMTQMQVFYGLYGYGATHSVAFEDVEVTGCLVLQDGMATGGGWFVPDADNSKGLVNQGGKATFGFVAKQKDGTSSGQLDFQYQADKLSLKSTSYDWVTISATQAMFEGTGTLNGTAGYKFRVRAVDGGATGGSTPDRFEIRIWIGDDTWDNPTYRAEGNLGGGQIVVHK